MNGSCTFENEQNVEFYHDKTKNDQVSGIKEEVDNIIPHEKNNTIPKINTYRHNFSKGFTEVLFNFAKIHQFDGRENYNEAWKEWVDENDDIIRREIQLLNSNGFDGDCIKKMYKSARYYFRTKSSEKSKEKNRRKYVPVTCEFIESIDEHVINYTFKNNISPHDGFINYCENNKELLKNEILEFKEHGIVDPVEITSKFKKTYKNRYFIYSKKNVN